VGGAALAGLMPTCVVGDGAGHEGGGAIGDALAARRDGNDASHHHAAPGAKYEPLHLALEAELDLRSARAQVCRLVPCASCPPPRALRLCAHGHLVRARAAGRIFCIEPSHWTCVVFIAPPHLHLDLDLDLDPLVYSALSRLRESVCCVGARARGHGRARQAEERLASLAPLLTPTTFETADTGRWPRQRQIAAPPPPSWPSLPSLARGTRVFVSDHLPLTPFLVSLLRFGCRVQGWGSGFGVGPPQHRYSYRMCVFPTAWCLCS
jgi:hypothetical protein